MPFKLLLLKSLELLKEKLARDEFVLLETILLVKIYLLLINPNDVFTIKTIEFFSLSNFSSSVYDFNGVVNC